MDFEQTGFGGTLQTEGRTGTTMRKKNHGQV